MKKYITFIAITLFFSGCTKTWSGVKQDSNKVWKDTKKVVHNATA